MVEKLLGVWLAYWEFMFFSVVLSAKHLVSNKQGCRREGGAWGASAPPLFEPNNIVLGMVLQKARPS